MKNQHFCRDDLLLAERQRRVQEKEWKVSRRTLEYEDALRRGRDYKTFKRLKKLEKPKLNSQKREHGTIDEKIKRRLITYCRLLP